MGLASVSVLPVVAFSTGKRSLLVSEEFRLVTRERFLSCWQPGFVGSQLYKEPRVLEVYTIKDQEPSGI